MAAIHQTSVEGHFRAGSGGAVIGGRGEFVSLEDGSTIEMTNQHPDFPSGVLRTEGVERAFAVHIPFVGTVQFGPRVNTVVHGTLRPDALEVPPDYLPDRRYVEAERKGLRGFFKPCRVGGGHSREEVARLREEGLKVKINVPR